MPFLTIDGSEVEVQTSQATEKPQLIGDKVRAFNGDLRTTYITVKRNLNFLSGPLIPADAITLLNKNGTIVLVAGDCIPASGNYLVTFEDAQYIDDRGTTYYRYLDILLEQQ